MARVLHRITKEYRKRANTPDYPKLDWIINPDLSAVAGFAPEYWTITGDLITLMPTAQRTAVDVAARTLYREVASRALGDKLRAVVQAINDGSLVPGGNLTGAQLRRVIRDKL